MSALTKSWYCPLRVPILWGQMDAFAHVNNTVYFVWFEQARLAQFSRLSKMSGNEDFLEPAKHGCVGPILSETSCRFRMPLTWSEGAEVVLASRVVDLQEDRFRHEYVVVSDGKLAAQGSGQVVFFDYAKGEKAAIPGEIRKAVEDLCAGPDELQKVLSSL